MIGLAPCHCLRGGLLRKAREGGVMVLGKQVRIAPDGVLHMVCKDCGRPHSIPATRRLLLPISSAAGTAAD
jgi:hypothetical protein